MITTIAFVPVQALSSHYDSRLDHRSAMNQRHSGSSELLSSQVRGLEKSVHLNDRQGVDFILGVGPTVRI